MIYIFIGIICVISYILYWLVRDKGLFLMIMGVSAIITGFLSFLIMVILDNVMRNRDLNINVSVITGYVFDKFLVYTMWVGIMGMVIFGIGVIIRSIYEKR